MEQIKEYLQKIEGYEKLLPPAKDEQMQILTDMVMQVKTQTDNYTKPEGISTDYVDIRPVISREQVQADDWIKHKGKLSRSEKDSLEWLIDELNQRISSPKKQEPATDPDRERRMKMAKVKIKMLRLKLELMKSQS
jgi:hypothetical protein